MDNIEENCIISLN